MTSFVYLLVVLAVTPFLFHAWIGMLLLISRVPMLSLWFAAMLVFAVRSMSFIMLLIVPRRCQHLTAIVRTAHLISKWPVSSLKAYLREHRALESLPLIKQGMRQLNISSLFEVYWRRDVLHRVDPTLISPLQRPIIFVPGIKARPFYSEDLYPWLSDAMELIPDIRREMQSVLSEQSGFRPYHNELGLPTHPFAKPPDQAVKTYDQNDWNMYFFYRGGVEIKANHQRCPITSSFLRSIPELEKTMVCFSALRPGIWVPPHYGLTNAIVRVHLPLVIPGECQIRVGEEIRSWQTDRPLLFDDSFEHEVWNRSQATRIVLFINTFHPLLNDIEQAALAKFLDESLGRCPAVLAWRNLKSSHHSPSRNELVHSTSSPI